MQINKKTIFALAMVALVASTGVGVATLSYDNETTTTTSTSDLVGGETVTDLDSENHTKYIEVISDNASTSTLTNPEEALTLKLTVNDAENKDDGYTFYVNDSANWTVENASNGHYSINLTHAAMFDEMPRDVNENVAVDVKVIFNESESDEEASTISINAQNSDERAVDVITDENVDSSSKVDLVNESRLRGDLDYAEIESDETLANNTTRVSVVFANDTVAEKYTNAYDAGDFSSGDYIWSMTAHSDGVPIMVFDSEKGEDIEAGWFSGGFDSSEETYGVFHLNGGDHGEHARLDVYPQGDDAENDELELKTAGNKSLGFWDNLKHFGTDAARSSGVGIAP